MPHVVKDILELYQVGSVCLHESLVSLEYLALMLRPARFLLLGFSKLQLIGLILRGGADVLNMEKLIKPETAKKTRIAVVHVDRAQTALAEFAKAESNARECAHKRRIHLLAGAQIDDEIPESALDHLFYKLLKTRAILEGSAALHFYPYGAVHAADKDRRCRVHSGVRNYPSPATAVKSLPLLPPHKRLVKGNDPAIDNQQNAPGGDPAKLEILVPGRGKI